MFSVVWKVMTGGAKNAMLDNMLVIHDAKLNFVPNVERPDSDAKAPPRQSFTSSVPPEKMSLMNVTLGQRRKLMPTMMKLMWRMNKSAKFYEKPLQAPSTSLAEDKRREIEEQARALGATDIRYVRLTDDCLLGGLGVPHRYAMVYTVEMGKEALDSAPSFECFHEVAKGYLRLATIGNHIAERLRKEGVAAYPGTALGGLTDYCRVAEKAGLGTIGYHGCLISKTSGAILRINTIYVSAEDLPFEDDDNETAWIRDFCANCKKCVRECPPVAIHDQPKVQENGRSECIETSKCLDYFAENFGCAICIDVCPFTQAGYEKIERGFKGKKKRDAPKFELMQLAASA